jgi:hypothetical protein
MCIKNQYMKAKLTKLDGRAVKRSHIKYDEVTFRLGA